MVMNSGVVEQIGPPLEVYDRPASVFGGGFIGSPSMNFLDARIDRDGTLVVGEDRLPLPEPWSGHAGRAVTLGLRPEHLQLADEPAPAAPHLHLRVALVEALGADTVVHGRIDASEQTLAVRLAGTSRVAAEDRLTLLPDLARLHLFDPATGRRLDERPGRDFA